MQVYIKYHRHMRFAAVWYSAELSAITLSVSEGNRSGLTTVVRDLQLDNVRMHFSAGALVFIAGEARWQPDVPFTLCAYEDLPESLRC